MTPYERLLAEELPTGRFGDGPATHTRRHPQPDTGPEVDPNAAAHRAALLAALDEKPRPYRHLHALPPAA